MADVELAVDSCFQHARQAFAKQGSQPSLLRLSTSYFTGGW